MTTHERQPFVGSRRHFLKYGAGSALGIGLAGSGIPLFRNFACGHLCWLTLNWVFRISLHGGTCHSSAPDGYCSRKPGLTETRLRPFARRRDNTA